MILRLEWLSLKFATPDAFANELYAAAKSSPSEFRRQIINRHLWKSLKHDGRYMLGLGVAAVALLVIGILSDSAFVILGCLLMLSCLLTLGSFTSYAIRYRSYWLKVQAAASDSDSYLEFLIIARERHLFANQSRRRWRL